MPNAIPQAIVAEARAWRHDFHQNPELAYEEHRTSAIVAAKLESFGYNVLRGLGGTGVVGQMSWGEGGPRVALRADMDALPILEETGLPYASKTAGVMHACGHDGHTAMLLAAAQLLSQRRDLHGTLYVIFQPAEEVEGGAKRMMDDGLFEHIRPDHIYGMHNWPQSAVGTAAAPDGALMAAFGVFDIEVIGQGAHGAMPHQSHDPVLAGAQIVGALQSIVARNISPLDPAVVSVTKIHGGEAYNVIPKQVTLSGTTRWFDDETGALIERRLSEVAGQTAAAFGCDTRIRYERRYPATINAPAPALIARRAIEDAGLGLYTPTPSMGAEDFAFMMGVVEGAYIWLGAQKAGLNPALHSPQFDFNDDALELGIGLWCALVTRSLRPEALD